MKKYSSQKIDKSFTHLCMDHKGTVGQANGSHSPVGLPTCPHSSTIKIGYISLRNKSLKFVTLVHRYIEST